MPRSSAPPTPRAGVVFLIGAGPGDPELITVRGVNALNRCDVVFHDAAINPVIIAQCRKTALRIPIAETITDNPSLLDTLNTDIVAHARQGKAVAVLQEGDPFIFGLGAEIALAVARAKVRFEVIPGITAALAAAAYAGIPLTYRGYSSTLAFATGHTDLNKKYTDVDWQKVATGVSTLVVFMGLDNLVTIVQKLIAHGRDPRTPVAIIGCGTMAAQQTITGSLAEIATRAVTDNLPVAPPAIIVIGDVVGLRDELNWFEGRAAR